MVGGGKPLCHYIYYFTQTHCYYRIIPLVFENLFRVGTGRHSLLLLCSVSYWPYIFQKGSGHFTLTLLHVHLITPTTPQILGNPPPLPIYLLLIHISRGPYQMVWHIIVTVIVYTQFGLTADFIEVQCRIFLACIAGLSEEYKKENVCIWFWANINVYDHVLLNLHSLWIWYSVLCAFQFANIITSRACASKSMSLCLSEQHNFTNIQIPCLFWYIVRPTKTDIV